MKGLRAAASVAKLRSLTVIVSMIVSNSLRSLPAKNVGARIKCSQLYCSNTEVNATERGLIVDSSKVLTC